MIVMFVIVIVVTVCIFFGIVIIITFEVNCFCNCCLVSLMNVVIDC